MALQLIKQLPNFEKKVIGENKISIAEMFCDTIQGEGVTSGVISTFIRTKGCTLNCIWCDSLEVWRYGNEYSFEEIFELFESVDLINKFKNGQNLILTGGSPLKQQIQLYNFISSFIIKYGFKPTIQVENEAVLMATPEFESIVDVWNNSPKLSNSEMKENIRFKPLVISRLSQLKNSWFKFVISRKEDWEEIEKTYLPLINKNQIILMPEGITQEDLNKNRKFVADLAIENQVRFSDRLHITLWNKKTGV